MHNLEPFYNWRELYRAEKDENSPFYGQEYSEFEYSDTIYNYYIHPQWDFFGSPTLRMKILIAEYNQGFAVIELIGEWNDAITNDIMLMKEEILEELMAAGIYKFILIGENVLNFHSSDELYYEALNEDLTDEGGWICLLNPQEHVESEMHAKKLHHYMFMGDEYMNVNWRALKPDALYQAIERKILKPKLPADQAETSSRSNFS